MSASALSWGGGGGGGGRRFIQSTVNWEVDSERDRVTPVTVEDLPVFRLGVETLFTFQQDELT
jgi:hypothetical protein